MLMSRKRRKRILHSRGTIPPKAALQDVLFHQLNAQIQNIFHNILVALLHDTAQYRRRSNLYANDHDKPGDNPPILLQFFIHIFHVFSFAG